MSSSDQSSSALPQRRYNYDLRCGIGTPPPATEEEKQRWEDEANKREAFLRQVGLGPDDERNQDSRSGDMKPNKKSA